MGDMADTLLALIEGNPAVDFVYTHKKDGKEYILDTREIRLELEEIPINNPQVIGLIRDNILRDSMRSLPSEVRGPNIYGAKIKCKNETRY